MARHKKGESSDIIHERPKQERHTLLDELTKVWTGDDVTIELLDAEFGDEFEAEQIPLAYIEYDEHGDEASVGVGGRDGRYPVVLRHSIEHPTSILTDSKPPCCPWPSKSWGPTGPKLGLPSSLAPNGIRQSPAEPALDLGGNEQRWAARWS